MSFFSSTAAIIGLIFSGVFLFIGLLTGCWKYFKIINTENNRAPYYVDTAHRASLMYSFASMVVAIFAQLSAFDERINVIAMLALQIYFFLSVASYIGAGLKNTTNNMLADHPHLVFMSLLMLAEIGGFLVLFVGFLVSLMH